MRKLTVCSNIFNEIKQLPRWFSWVKRIADGGIIIVDSGSTDGSVEYATDQGALVIVGKIIQTEGYGPARTQLRELTKEFHPDSKWMVYFDADEDLNEKEFHQLRWIKDYLIDDYDVVAFPRIDWHDFEKTKAENDFRFAPDWQARMTRLDSPITYVRKLHEQITGYKKIYCNLTTPKLNHYHRAIKEKRDFVGKLCAKLHYEDVDFGASYPKHHKEDFYYEQYLREGL